MIKKERQRDKRTKARGCEVEKREKKVGGGEEGRKARETRRIWKQERWTSKKGMETKRIEQNEIKRREK